MAPAIRIYGRVIAINQALITMANLFILFYKPYDVLSQFTVGSGAVAPDPAIPKAMALGAERKTLKQYIPLPGVYPVGRLDRDSEGLMLLTNHGQVQHRLSDPRYAHPRTYWVQVERVPTLAAIRQLSRGVLIKTYRTLPCEVKLLLDEPKLPPREPPIRFRKTVPTAWLAITLREGKNRQVRRMTAAVGHPTLRLVRVALGPLQLDNNLSPGQWRHATAAERQRLLDF
jgi:23S rRNA pseudouridine2457 synthase